MWWCGVYSLPRGALAGSVGQAKDWTCSALDWRALSVSCLQRSLFTVGTILLLTQNCSASGQGSTEPPWRGDSHPAGSLPQHRSLFCIPVGILCHVRLQSMFWVWREGLQCKKLFLEFLHPSIGSKGHYEGFALPENPVEGPCVYLKHQTTKHSAGRKCSLPATVSPCHGGDPLYQNPLNLGILALSPWTVTEPRQEFVNPHGCPKDIHGLSSCRMCRGAPRLCVPLLAPVPVSGLEKSCSAYALLLGEMSSFCFPSELRPFI